MEDTNISKTTYNKDYTYITSIARTGIFAKVIIAIVSKQDFKLL